MKVIGRLPGERSCLSLVWAVLDRASRGWRGVEMSPKVVRHLQERRRELLSPPDRSHVDDTANHDSATTRPSAVTAAA